METFEIIQDPQDERIERTSALNMFDIAMRQSDETLDIIKGIMLTQKEEFPALHMQFIGACTIDDNTGGGSPSLPDFEFTVLAGTFHTAVTLPYSPTRSFKATNLNSQNINWGLSEVEGSFSNLANVLNANSTSTKTSVTLGGSGDHLIFENTSPDPISIELTVFEE